MRATPSAWQPPMARPLSLWRPGAPAFPVCPPLWVSGFPSTQTQSQGAPISCVALGKSPTPSGCQLSHPPHGIIKGRKRVSRQGKTLNVRGSREALGKWKWLLCDHLAGGQGVPECVFTRL